MSNTYSQLNQDLNVLSVLNYKKNGYYVEIGASDGITLSNTYLLEKEYDWKGICVEPIPYRYNELIANRPNSYCCDSAIYNKSNTEVVFDIANNYDLLSGINETMNNSHKEEVETNKSQILVKTITFNDLLEKYNSPLFIDYLSLDTEGSELEILKSVNFNKYTFGIIDVEHNYQEDTRNKIRELLITNGYKYIRENSWDDCYQHFSI